MKTVLIMGINGGFGGHVARAMAQHGWQIKALMRDPAKLPSEFITAHIVQGDACQIEDVRHAAKDVDLIVYGINPSSYQWKNKVIPWLDITATVAEEMKLTLVFPGNVYVFNPEEGPEFSEDSAHHPVSSKGEMRKAMEQRLKRAGQHGAKVIIVRAGDFIGAHAHSTWMQHIIKPTKKGYVVNATGPHDLTHTWAYLPDLAQTIVALVKNSEQLPTFNVFHFKGHRICFNELANTIATATGKPVVMKNFPWLVIRLLTPFSSMMRSLIEMSYLWKQEINLTDKKLTELLDTNIAHTSLAQALLESGSIKK